VYRPLLAAAARVGRTGLRVLQPPALRADQLRALRLGPGADHAAGVRPGVLLGRGDAAVSPVYAAVRAVRVQGGLLSPRRSGAFEDLLPGAERDRGTGGGGRDRGAVRHLSVS